MGNKSKRRLTMSSKDVTKHHLEGFFHSTPQSKAGTGVHKRKDRQDRSSIHNEERETMRRLQDGSL